MQIERRPQHTPQEIQVTHLVPEQALGARQNVLIDMLQTLPTPITITPHEDIERQTTYYTYHVGEQTEDRPFGIAMGATPNFLDALRFSLEAAMQHSAEASGGEVDVI
jgi:hypothetical protein